MNPCVDCDLDTNLTYCCHTNPDTKESKLIKLIDGAERMACPNFDISGCCGDYENRPQNCIDFQCHEFYEKCDILDLFR